MSVIPEDERWTEVKLLTTFQCKFSNCAGTGITQEINNEVSVANQKVKYCIITGNILLAV